MRVLHLDSGRSMRGGQWQVLRLMEGLRALGVESVLLARRGSPLFERAAELGIEVSSLTVAVQCLGRMWVDLAHAHDARSHTLAACLARLPLLASRRVAFPIGRGWLSRWKYRQAAHYIAVSEFVKRGMIGSGIPAEKISVVHDGVPLLPVRERGERIVAPRPTDDKPAELYPAGLEIFFSGDLAADLPGAGMFLYLTRSEGLGSGVLLAMSAGVPVIASKTGGIPEIIEHERNGLLVDGGSKAAAEAAGRLARDRDFAQLLAARGRRTVEERFTVEIMARKTLEVYRQVLAC